MDIETQQTKATATIQIIRDVVAPTAPQTGKMSFGGNTCDTLERPNVDPEHACIPKGTYRVQMMMSPHFGVVLPHIMDVPGRSDILIHWGNTVADSHGCVLAGVKVNSTEIKNSRVTVGTLVEWIEGLGDVALQLVMA